jgi:glutaredoxin
MYSHKHCTAPRAPRAAFMLLLVVLLSSESAWALYKVVGPDGRVTYTDRPPSEGTESVTELRLRVPPPAAASKPASAPAERNKPTESPPTPPVDLFTGAACDRCEEARTWLVKRGLPYREFRVDSDEDRLAYRDTMGGKSLPGLRTSKGSTRGFSINRWQSLIDDAGYSPSLQLPDSWRPAPATPLAGARNSRNAKP